MKPARIFSYIFLWTKQCTTFNSIPIILNLLTNKIAALIYSVTICEQKTKVCATSGSFQHKTAASLLFPALHNLPPLITMPKLRKRMNNKLYSCLLTHGPTSGIRTQAILVGGKWSHHCTSLACSNEHVCIFKKCVKWLEIRPRPQVSPNFLTRRFFLRFRPHKTLKRWKGLSKITPSLTGHALYDVWHHRIRNPPFSRVHGKR